MQAIGRLRIDRNAPARSAFVAASKPIRARDEVQVSVYHTSLVCLSALGFAKLVDMVCTFLEAAQPTATMKYCCLSTTIIGERIYNGIIPNWQHGYYVTLDCRHHFTIQINTIVSNA